MKVEDERYVVTRGFIDGRDAPGVSGALSGVFLTILFEKELKYTGALFSRERMDRKMPFSDLVAVLEKGERERSEETLFSYAFSLRGHLSRNYAARQQENEITDNKRLERSVTLFCSDTLGISAIVFVDTTTMTEEEISSIPFLVSKMASSDESAEETVGEKASEHAPKNSMERENISQKELFIACHAILDPVAGTPVSDLSKNNRIFCRLPESSIFYKFFVNRIPGFDGTVMGDVTGVRINDNGMAIVAVELADNLTGAVKLSSKVRVKTAYSRGFQRTDPGKNAKSESIIAIASLLFFLCVMWLLIHFLS